LFSQSTGNSVAFIYYKELSLYSIRVIFQPLIAYYIIGMLLFKREIIEGCHGLSWQKSTVNRTLVLRDHNMQPSA
jgi:hypothetical protein